MPNESYVAVLEDSLKKKVDILRQLQLLCQEQSDILDDANMTPEVFEENVDKKGKLIARLEGLDEGFEQLYGRVKDEMTSNGEHYKERILRMQELIRDITDRSVQIQVMESRNKDKAQIRFGEVRNQIREVRHSGKAVSNYYQNMMKMNTVDPQFMDSKK